jgi:phosphoglycolate phosphatase-like HAD superfamily hydrolase
MQRRPNLVIFDLDGTLIDTMGSFADLAGALIKEHYGWSFEKGRKRYLETSGIPFFQQMEILFPSDKRNENVVDLFEKRKISVFVKESISEKTRETLLALRDKEVRTAISSNNFHDLVRDFVLRNQIPVDLALGFKENFAKGPEHFDHINKYFSISFESMVFVGDSLNDAKRSRERNIPFVAKVGTFSRADFERVTDPRPIMTIFEIHELMSIVEIQ